MSLSAIRNAVLPRLAAARVERLTLTGGEPFVHPDLLDICQLAVNEGMSVGICTNGTGITDSAIAFLAALSDVHVNVSFDGFRKESHGRFRGSPESFQETRTTARRLAEAGILQGLLSTPNALTTVEDYASLCEFAVEVEAEYVLMNPLSPFGRGVHSERRLALDASQMNAVLEQARDVTRDAAELVPIRFPNDELPLSPCVAGNIIYVFVGGEVAVCPYLVFAARSPRSRYSENEFIVGNILEEDVAEALDSYHFHERFTVGSNETCQSCPLGPACGKGCPAAVIARGGQVGDRDIEVCPVP